ncbi:MAG: hypothetical protein [Olavius algarvensis Gamma 3 endosymbiont]|nr:MAG: hypothetical protein [Olavius algarvensis Gamma 3 endosymbiont]
MPGARSLDVDSVDAETYRVDRRKTNFEYRRPASGCQEFLSRATTATENSVRETYRSIPPFIGVRPDFADELPGNRTLADAADIYALDQGNGGQNNDRGYNNRQFITQ